jgi:hypothetical protein
LNILSIYRILWGMRRIDPTHAAVPSFDGRPHYGAAQRPGALVNINENTTASDGDCGELHRAWSKPIVIISKNDARKRVRRSTGSGGHGNIKPEQAGEVFGACRASLQTACRRLADASAEVPAGRAALADRC